jgi:signal peptide peptidase SppA
MSLETIAVPRFSHVHDYTGAWAIEERAGQALWNLARGKDLFAHVELRLAGMDDDGSPVPKPKAALELQPDGRGKSVATVRVEGTLMKRSSSLAASSGTVQMRRDIRQAANDPEVSAILLAIDSPGGTVAGTDDLAAEVKAATKKKPVMAFVSDLCASAAYWVASQADAIFVNSTTALVGSIGTVMTVYDVSKAADKAGVEALVFATGPLKGAGTEGTAITEEQRSYFQQIVDSAQGSFDAAVQKGRSLTDNQLKAVRTGGVFDATEAESKKLIDGVKSHEQVVAALVKEAYSRNPRPARSAASDPVPTRGAAMSRENDDVIDLATATADPVAETITAGRRQMAAEFKRVAAIHAIEGSSKQPGLVAEAIENGWDAEKAEYKIKLANLPKVTAANPHAGPNFIFGKGKYEPGAGAFANGAKVEDVLAATMQMSLGRREVEKNYGANVLESASENFRGYGLQQVLLLAAAHNGHPVGMGERVHNGNLKSLMRAAFPDDDQRRAANGTSQISMSGILGAVANKELLAGYVEGDMAWKEVSVTKSVTNFQQYTSYRMLDDMEYDELGQDGQIKHGTTSQESYTRQAKTYAKMFVINRQQWINDDLGAFDDIRNRLGGGANKKFNKVFWTEFLSDLATFWTAARTNYISGSTTNLGTDGVGLGLGVKAFRQMTSPSADGTKHINADTQNPVGGSPGGRPEILLVPPELEANAEILYRNTNLGAVASSSANIYANKYRPVVAWQLSNSSYTGYSTTAWFLLNSPAVMSAVVVSFLNGQMSPTVESADADFNTLGVMFRGYHDFGVDQAEYLAGVLSKGAA